HATRAAVEVGIVAGGGVALVRAISALDGMSADNEDQIIGIQIVRKALESPLRTIADNAGVEGSVILQTVINSEGSHGYNARTDEFVDLKKAGVIDPTKVTRIALENAASIAGMVLTTECVISDKPEPEAPHSHGGGMPGGMGGMM
ncbi:MAG: TCP-1/cpn60 chaperonin family protein, partial [Bacteroidota bacterium]